MTSAEQKTLLLVEDEPIVAIAEKKTLASFGYNVITVNTGESAIETVDRSDPAIDLVLMDIDLGDGMDGTEAASEILSRHDLPLVFLSSHTEPEYVERTEGITSYGYVVKNSADTVLHASIKMAFRLFEAKRTASEKEEQLERYFTSSLDLLCISDTEGRVVRLNPQWETVLGYSVDELTGRSLLELLHHDDREATREALSRVAQQQELQSFENRYRCKNGEYRRLEWRARPVANLVYAVARDITERKRAEHQLRTSEEFQKALIESSPLPVIGLDTQRCVTTWNAAAEEVFGWRAEEVIGRSLPYYPADGAHDEYAPVLDSLINGTRVAGREVVRKTKSGELRDVRLWLSPIRDSNGVILGSVGTVQDITDELRRRSELSAEKTRFETLFNQAPMPIVLTDEQRRVVLCNEAFAHLFGYSCHEAQDRCLDDMVLPPEADPQQESVSLRALRSGGVVHHEGTRRRKDGSCLEVAVSCLSMTIGSARYVYAIYNDISAHKAVERALRERETLLERAQQVVQIGIWELPVASNRLIWSDEVYRIFGLEPQQGSMSYEAYLDLVHPQDRQEVDAAYRDSIRKNQDEYRIEYRIIRAESDEVRHVIETCTHQRDLDGTITRSVGIVQDITELRSAEQALQDSETMFREIAEHSFDAITIVDFDGYYLYSNPAEGFLVAANPDDLAGQKAFDYIDPEDRAEIRQMFEEFRRGERTEGRGVCRVVCSGGGRAWTDYRATVLHDDDGNPSKVLVIDRDITEFKNKEEQIASYVQQQELLLKESHHRIKNHMATISGLLLYHREELQDRKAREVLMDTASRAQSMMMLYDKLYRAEQYDSLNIRDYLTPLVQETVCLNDPSGTVTATIRADDIHLNASRVAPLGMLLTEMITNSIKHAFPNTADAGIVIRISREERAIRLEYADNGVGFSDSVDDRRDRGFGLELIEMLAEQIAGTLTLHREHGTRYVIEFPA